MRPRSLLFAATAAIALSAIALSAVALSAVAQETQTLNVAARLVVVPVTIRDNKDRLITDLKKDDFTLTVDGKPAPIRYFDKEDDLPLTIGLLVDVSGSLAAQIDNERTASSAFLDGMLQPERDRAFIVQFGHTADLLADITGSIPKLQAGLQKIEGDSGGRPSFSNGNDPNDPNNTGNSTNNNGNNNGGYGGGHRGGRGGNGGGMNGGTVLYDAVFLSSDDVLKNAPLSKTGEAAGHGRKAIVLLTDGEDRGSKENIAEAIEAAQRNDVALYAIYYKGEQHNNGGGFPGGGGRHGGGGFPGMGGGGWPGGGGGGRGGNNGGGNREHVDGKKILERMADETGGRVYEVSKKLPLPDIYKQIAEELRSQYRLGFTPVNNEDGYHKLIVDLPKDRKAILQARDGYYTGAAK